MGLSCVRKYQTKYTLYLERLFQALERQSYHAFLGQTWLPAFRKHIRSGQRNQYYHSKDQNIAVGHGITIPFT
jgi:hypothetical protein